MNKWGIRTGVPPWQGEEQQSGHYSYKTIFYGKSVRQLELMERIYDATIMGIASSYQSLWNLLNEQFKKNLPYQIKCEKYHFDTPFISPLSF
ncbi:MAG: hypothetical protein ACRDDN_06830 [Aeromonas veronii]